MMAEKEGILETESFRLVTRSDFDGIASAVLLKKLGLVKELKFVHPKDVQDGLVEITRDDITTNLPYSPSSHYSFDNHISELKRVGEQTNYVIDPTAKSSTRVVWKMFGGKKSFPDIDEDFIEAVDKSDSADFSIEDILNPQGWVLLSFIMDARTGLGRYKDFRLSTFDLMSNLVEMCMTMSKKDILNHPDIKERIKLLNEYKQKFIEQIRKNTTIYKNVAIVNMLNERKIYPGNRFMVYGLYPEINVSIHEFWRTINKVGVLAVGKSIFNRTNTVSIGELMLKYNGGGHRHSGSCQIRMDKMKEVENDILRTLTLPEYNKEYNKE